MFNYRGYEERIQKISKGYQGVTGSFYNTELYLPESSGAVTLDPVTGNYVLETLQTVIVKAKLVQKKDPNITLNQGVDTIRTYMEGWLIDPYYYDGAIPNYLDCKVLQNNLWQSGKFTFLDCIPTNCNERFKIYLALGQRIKGYFEVTETSL